MIVYEWLRDRWAGAFTLIVAGMLVGCGGSDNGRVPVTGTVTIDGKPLEHGDVLFMNSTSGASVGVGAIDNGEYQLWETATIEGVRPGSYQVRIESWIETPDQYINGRFSKGIPNIPRKYMDADTSGFTAEVPDHGATIDFALSSAESKQ